MVVYFATGHIMVMTDMNMGIGTTLRGKSVERYLSYYFEYVNA